MKLCPECKYQFGDEHEFCPRHGKRLDAATVHVNPAPYGPGAATVFYNPHEPKPKENYERLIGTVLDGRYHLLEIRGEGGMGVVFRARHTVIEKIVAVKILKREVARDRAVVQRFVQEAKAASRIGHWSIVDVTDFGTLPDGSAYQVMEYIGGDTLAKVNSAGPMWAARVLPIVGQIARALAAAHDKGIVHRDLKPENIFLTEKDGKPDMVKIVDFGIAKFAPMGSMDVPTRITRAGAVFGTPEYMAPEQAAGRSDNDHRVDIYALGVIMYEMLVGRVPHKGDSVVATLAQQMLDPVVPPRTLNPHADVSQRIEKVILTALAKDRDQRYQSMFEMWQALEWAAEELGIQLVSIGGPPSGQMAPLSTPGGITIDGKRRPTDRLRDNVTVEMNPPVGRRGGRLGYALLGIAAVASVTVALAFAIRTPSGSTADAPRSAGGPDAGGPIALVAAPADAPITVPTLPVDAAVIEIGPDLGPNDAGHHTGTDRPNPPERPRPVELPPIATPTDPVPDPPGDHMGRGPDTDVVITTRPHGASLYMGGLAAGSDGMTLRRPRGTRLQIRCMFPGNDGWTPKNLTLVFDGQTREYVCQMDAKTRCVKDLQNPFKPCP